MDPEFLEIVKLDLAVAFGRGAGAMTADPVAVKQMLDDSQVIGWIKNHAVDSTTWSTSRHRFTVLHYARVVGQAAAQLAIADEHSGLTIREPHIRTALVRVGNVWPSSS